MTAPTTRGIVMREGVTLGPWSREYPGLFIDYSHLTARTPIHWGGRQDSTYQSQYFPSTTSVDAGGPAEVEQSFPLLPLMDNTILCSQETPKENGTPIEDALRARLIDHGELLFHITVFIPALAAGTPSLARAEEAAEIIRVDLWIQAHPPRPSVP